MELRHLRYFVAAAEEVHFGRAARRLHISGPALGVQIRELEQELGAGLFERLPRGVRLTAAGRSLLADSRRLLSELQQAIERVEQVSRGEGGVLRVGHVPRTILRRSGVGNLIAEFCVHYPRAEVLGLELTSVEQAEALRDGRIDVALGYVPTAAPGTETEVLDYNPLNGALLPATHPLARKTPLYCRDLAVLPMLQGLRSVNRDAHDSMLRELKARALEVRLDKEHQIPDAAVLFGLIAAGAGWMPANASTADLLLSTNPGVVFREWKDPPIVRPYCIQWRSDDRSALVANFVTLARELRDGPASEPSRYPSEPSRISARRRSRHEGGAGRASSQHGS